jgi:acetyl esterase/lipase
VTTTDTIRLWPGAAPGSEDWTHEEETFVEPSNGMFVYRNVVVPTLTPVLPQAGSGNGTAVVVAPGGAFAALAWQHEGTATAQWFADRGVAAFVLKYRTTRLPSDMAELVAQIGPMPDPRDGPAMMAWLRKGIGNTPDLATADGEQAIRVLREQADQWGIDPARVGIIGFSAGGTVAIQTAATTDVDARPAFVADIYGAFCDRDIPSDAPPFFAVVAADDTLCRDALLDTTRKWLNAGVPAVLHVYEAGGHGFGLTPQGTPVDTWTERLADWLATRGFLPSGATK